MTDNDILKALECCSKPHCNNSICPMFDNTINTKDCITKLSTNALDLISRQKAEKEALIAGQETLQKYIAEQKAEIEGLEKLYDQAYKESLQWKTEVERLQKLLDDNCNRCIERERAKGKAEAITEFAERLKEKKLPMRTCVGVRDMVEVLFVDRIAREMKGEQ